MNLFNIIIPVYNNGKTIASTVDSIQESGLTDFSIIIIDDGSLDNTKTVCRELENKYYNIRIYSQTNQGVSVARNRGIELADAEYLIFFDGDDHVDAGAFAHAEQIIKEKNPDMLIYGMCFDYYHNGKVFRTDKIMYPDEACYSADEVQSHFKEFYKNNALTSSCNKIVRRRILQEKKVRYIEGIFVMEDFLFSLDCIQYCESVYMLPEAIYRYHQSEDEGNVYRRMKQVDSLSEFMLPFKTRLYTHPDIFSSVYFMMLNQKLWFANVKEIKKIAQDHIRGGFVAYTDVDKVLDNELREGRYSKIRCRNLVLQARHRIANVVKRSLFYQRIKKGE